MKTESGRSSNWIIAATVLGSSLVFIDGTVVAIALPIVQRAFGATAFDTQWVIESYTLVLGALMLLFGALADRYGRKRMFVVGTIVFAAGSILCGLAGSMPALVGARILQAVGGTMLAPASLALLGATFEGADRGRAIGTWSGLTAVAGAIGPVAGGTIVDHLGWRWVFFINVPISIAVVAIALIHVRESRDEAQHGGLDLAGSAAITVGLAGVVYAFISAGQAGWTTAQIVSLAVGIAALGAFAFIERRSPSPILPFGLFSNRSFTGINVMTFLLYGALGGLFYFLPFVMILVNGYSATVTGLAMLPFLVLIVTLSRFSAVLVYRVGRRAMLTAGPAVAALGFAAFALLPNLHYWTGIFPSMVLVGIGMGFTVAPLTTSLIDSVAEAHVGLASGVNNAVSRVASLLAIAILGALIGAAFTARLDTHMQRSNVTAAERSQILAQRDAMAAARHADQLERRIVSASYLDAFRSVALACAILAAASALTAAVTQGESKATAA